MAESADPRVRPSRRHDPALQAAKARKAAADPAVQAKKSRAMRRWWTPARRQAWSVALAQQHRDGRRPPPPRRVWTDAERAAQGARQRRLWAMGRFALLLEGWRQHARARWTAGVYAGQGARLKALWAIGHFAPHAARYRALWRAGHWFGNRRWRGGLRQELLERFPAEAVWIAGLSDAALAGLLSAREERGRFGVPLDRIDPGERRPRVADD